MIIAILASMISFAMSRVQQTARKASTQALITKLHTVIARQWDTYATRRVDIGSTTGMTQNQIDDAKLAAIRNLMRMELPTRWASDVNSISGTAALNDAYKSYYTAAYNNNGKDTENASAECLYMIVSMIADDDLDRINLFSESDVGDVDEDGMNEFVDAWGNPILFIRWPAGFVDDPPNFSSTEPIGHLSDLQQNDPTGSPDPFDPQGVGTGATGNYAIFPLIFSAGPDKLYDICVNGDNSGVDDPYAGLQSGTPHDPFDSASKKVIDGAPADQGSNTGAVAGNGTLDHHDNIHNHHLGGSLR